MELNKNGQKISITEDGALASLLGLCSDIGSIGEMEIVGNDATANKKSLIEKPNQMVCGGIEKR
jgi:hypothetical protein